MVIANDATFLRGWLGRPNLCQDVNKSSAPRRASLHNPCLIRDVFVPRADSTFGRWLACRAISASPYVVDNFDIAAASQESFLLDRRGQRTV